MITFENHSIIGGLGSIVAEQMAEAGIGKKLYRIGLHDTFVHGASKGYLMKEYHIDAMSMIALVESITGKQYGIREESLMSTYTPAIHSDAKAEAL